MKVGKSTVSSCRPPDYEIKDLGNGFDIAANDDITYHEVIDEETGDLIEVYKYSRYAAYANINNYGEAVAALVHLKYSLDDEVALLKKGMQNPEDEEYVVYLEYVERCKEFARTIWTE